MAWRPPRACPVQGCPELLTGSQRRCPEHERTWRGTSASRGYGHRWRQLRAQQLRREPCCRACEAEHGLTTVATEVDHILRRELGGSDDPSNLQSLCKPCHSRKTAGEVLHP